MTLIAICSKIFYFQKIEGNEQVTSSLHFEADEDNNNKKMSLFLSDINKQTNFKEINTNFK